jgi:hypothetical protein
MVHVEIKIIGKLDPSWTDWLGDLMISHLGQDETLLCGELADQAALYGLIAKLRDLGIKLISVNSQEL